LLRAAAGLAVPYLRIDGDKAPHPPEFERLAVAGRELHRPQDISCPAGVTFQAAQASL
jgi:hypothetical protein